MAGRLGAAGGGWLGAGSVGGAGHAWSTACGAAGAIGVRSVCVRRDEAGLPGGCGKRRGVRGAAVMPEPGPRHGAQEAAGQEVPVQKHPHPHAAGRAARGGARAPARLTVTTDRQLNARPLRGRSGGQVCLNTTRPETRLIKGPALSRRNAP